MWQNFHKTRQNCTFHCQRRWYWHHYRNSFCRLVLSECKYYNSFLHNFNITVRWIILTKTTCYVTLGALYSTIQHPKHCYLTQLTAKPNRHLSTWTAYRVNEFKFHTKTRRVGKRTYNCSVCVCGTGEGAIENDYYGILKDIVQLEYVSEPLKWCVLFSYEWFDSTLNRGTWSHKLSKLIKVYRIRRYRKYDPFIFPNTAS